MRSIPILFLALLCAGHLHAQYRCGSDRTLALMDPGVRTQSDRLIATMAMEPGARGGDVLVIPVVIHIIEYDVPGPTNAEIIALVDEINLRFENAAPFDHPVGHDMRIQLCLATVGPTGAATTGIMRVNSPLAYHSAVDEAAMKALSRWDPHLYLNLWVVEEVVDTGFSGYARYPGSHGHPVDGVVMQRSWVQQAEGFVHDIGHYFGLLHTFDNGCVNFNCLLDGDRVCDTPPDMSQYTCGAQSCTTAATDTTGLSPFTGPVPELPNYMDYSSCMETFTIGQRTRMHDMIAAFRASLLQSNGCGANPGQPAPVYSYLVDSTACTGTVTFTNTSTNVLFTQWDADGGAWDGTGGTFTWSFPATGNYTVRMMTSGFGGGDTVLINLFVRVPPTPQYPIVNGYQGFSVDPFLQQPAVCHGTTITLSGPPGMASYQWSTGETTPSIQFAATSSFGLQLTVVDADGLAWTNCIPVAAQVRQPLQLNTWEPADTVNCNGGAMFHLTPLPSYPPSNTWYHDGAVIASNTYLHFHVSMQPGDHTFWVVNTDPIGCVLHSDTFQLHNIGLPPITLQEVGNALMASYSCMNVQWVIDGVPSWQTSSMIANPWPACYQITCNDCGSVTSPVYCILPTGMDDMAAPVHSVAPVPVIDALTIRPAPAPTARVSLLDASGRLVLGLPNDGSGSFRLGALSPGVYLLRIREGERQAVVRVVKG